MRCGSGLRRRGGKGGGGGAYLSVLVELGMMPQQQNGTIKGGGMSSVPKGTLTSSPAAHLCDLDLHLECTLIEWRMRHLKVTASTEGAIQICNTYRGVDPSVMWCVWSSLDCHMGV